MAKYRKKPVVIEAVQWFQNGDHPEVKRMDPETFDQLAPGKTSVYGHNKNEMWGWSALGVVGTPEGRHIVIPGDWVITGVQGEFYPCKPDIFEATYEVVK